MIVLHLCFIPLSKVNEWISIRLPLHSRAWMIQPSRRRSGRCQPRGGCLENPSGQQSNNLFLSFHPSRRLTCDQSHPSSQQSKTLPLSLRPRRCLLRQQQNSLSQQSKSQRLQPSCRV